MLQTNTLIFFVVKMQVVVQKTNRMVIKVGQNLRTGIQCRKYM